MQIRKKTDGDTTATKITVTLCSFIVLKKKIVLCFFRNTIFFYNTIWFYSCFVAIVLDSSVQISVLRKVTSYGQ